MKSSHLEHAKASKLTRTCSVHDINFGGECFNCGWKPEKEIQDPLLEMAKYLEQTMDKMEGNL